MNGRRVDIGEAISIGWDAVMQHPGPTIGGYLIMVVLSFVGGVIPFVNFLCQFFVAPALTGGVIVLFIKAVERQQDPSAPPPEVGDIFAGFQNYGAWLGLYWLFVVVVLGSASPFGVGAVVFAVTQDSGAAPLGIAAMVLGAVASLAIMMVLWLRWCMVYLIVADETVPCRVVEAFTHSAEMTEGHRGQLFVAFLVIGLVTLAGILACGIGILLSAPVGGCAGVAVYKQLGAPRVPAATASPLPAPPLA